MSEASWEKLRVPQLQSVVKFMWQHDRMKLVEKIDQKNPENLIKIIPTLRSISHDSYYWDNLCWLARFAVKRRGRTGVHEVRILILQQQSWDRFWIWNGKSRGHKKNQEKSYTLFPLIAKIWTLAKPPLHYLGFWCLIPIDATYEIQGHTIYPQKLRHQLRWAKLLNIHRHHRPLMAHTEGRS